MMKVKRPIKMFSWIVIVVLTIVLTAQTAVAGEMTCGKLHKDMMAAVQEEFQNIWQKLWERVNRFRQIQAVSLKNIIFVHNNIKEKEYQIVRGPPCQICLR